MTPSTIRLLQGLAQTARTISGEAGGADLQADLASIGVALNELMLREDPEFYTGFYHQGRALLAEALDQAPETADAPDPETLPEQLAPGLGYDEIDAYNQRLVTVLNDWVKQAGVGAEAGMGDFFDRLAAWELSHYRHRVLTAPANDPGAVGKSRGQMITDRRRVQEYLQERFPGWKNLEIKAFNALPGGFSKVTVVLDCQDELNGAQSLVIRAEQPVKLLYFEASEIPMEFGAIKLAFDAGLPVAEPLWLETDTGKLGCRFLVSRKAQGVNFGTAVKADRPLPPELMADVMNVLVRLHGTPVQSGNQWVDNSHLRNWLGCRTVSDALRRDIENTWGFVAKTGVEPTPLLVRIFQWLRAHVPDCDEPPVLLHHDYGLHNMLFEDNRLAALLDWESCQLGDPADDLQWLASNLRGKHTEDEIVQAYFAAGGREVTPYRLRFAEVLRVANVIIVCLTALKLFSDHPDASISLAMLGLKFMYPAIAQIEQSIEAAEACRPT